MKKTPIILMLIFLISLFLAVAAPQPPLPVRFTLEINGVKANFDDVKVTNLATGEVVTKADIPQLEMESGICGFDLSEFQQGYTTAVLPYYIGDEIEVVICSIHPDCTFTFNVDSSLPPTAFWFDTKIPTEAYYVCWDSSVVTDPTNCPAQPTPEPEPEPVAETEPKVSSIDSTTAKVEVYYGQEIDIKIGDNKLAFLLDEVIDFNDKDIDVQEEIYFKGITKTSLDEEDFGLESYLLIEEEAIEYRYVFVDEIDLNEISKDEPLTIDFLGKTIRIIEAKDNSITVLSGREINLPQGGSEDNIKVIAVMADSVLIEVDGVSKSISEGSSGEINGVDILVDEITYQGFETGIKNTRLIIGDNVQDTYNNGDDFELFSEDETFKWMINLPSYVGITNQEEYKYLDEDLTPLTVGDSILLPNNYLEIKFKEVTSSDRVEMKFKVRDDYLSIKGNLDDSFVYSSEEYDELYVKANGIYDEDKELISTDKVRIGDSDTYLELGSIKIGKLEIKLDMSDILYDGVSFSSKDRDYLDYFGLIFKDPEQAVDDKSGFVVSVPEERPEIVITFSSEVEEEPEPIIFPTEPVTPVEPIEPVTPVEPVIEPVKPTEPVVEPVKPVTPVEPVKPVELEEEGGIFLAVLQILGLLLAALGVGWRAGYLGLVKYYWKKGEKARAIKMLFTATKRAKEDYYKNKK